MVFLRRILNLIVHFWRPAGGIGFLRFRFRIGAVPGIRVRILILIRSRCGDLERVDEQTHGIIASEIALIKLAPLAVLSCC